MSDNHMKWLVAVGVTGALLAIALGSAWAQGQGDSPSAAAKDGGALAQLGAKEAGVFAELAGKDGGAKPLELAAKDGGLFEQLR